VQQAGWFKVWRKDKIRSNLKIRSDLAIYAVHAIPPTPCLFCEFLAADGIWLTAVPFYEHLAQQGLRFLQKKNGEMWELGAIAGWAERGGGGFGR
jgi:hypothetical protein